MSFFRDVFEKVKGLFGASKHEPYFQDGAPKTQAYLCAEMSRLVYEPFEDNEKKRQEIEQVLAGIGFDQVEFFDSTDTQAMFATHSGKSLDVLAFRGTEATKVIDIVSDVTLLPVPWHAGGMAHVGFQTAISHVWDEIKSALDRRHGEKLLFTGHSLGAALATLAASTHPPTALYTFGSPLVGDPQFVRTLDRVPYERYVHCCDIVCRVPPTFLGFGFSHAGTRHYIDRNRAVRPALSDAEVVADQQLARRSLPITLPLPQLQEEVSKRDLDDHSCLNYVQALRAIDGG